MARPDWTVVVQGRDGVRRIRVSRDVARLGIAAALLAFALVGTAATGLLDDGRVTTTARLAEENQALRAELDALNARLDTLGSALDEMETRDAFIRALAGLDPLAEEVRPAIVELPAAETADGRALGRIDRALARRAYESRGALDGLLRRARLLSYSWSEAEETLREHRTRLESTPSIFPTNGYVSSTFSQRRWHPLLDRPRPHEGLDIVAPAGTPIVAAAGGRVSFAGTQGEYGLMIELDHGNGIVTRYAHASRLLRAVGDVVARGDTIGRVGSSGLAVGSHLHYEVLVNGEKANPRHYILNWTTIPD